MGFYTSPTESSACKVAELNDAHASLMAVFLCFSTNIEHGSSVFASPFTYLHDFLYNVFDSQKNHSIALFLPWSSFIFF